MFVVSSQGAAGNHSLVLHIKGSYLDLDGFTSHQTAEVVGTILCTQKKDHILNSN